MAETNSMVRVGFVSDVRKSNGTARVCFPDMDNMVSDWLYVMRYPNLTVSASTGSAGSHSHGGAVSGDGSHSHNVSTAVTDWFPKVNDKVLVLMAYGFNSDGYILGVIQ